MINKIYQDFASEKYDKERNYNKIMQKVKAEKKSKTLKFSRIQAIAVALIVICIITPTMYAKIKWDIEFKEYQYRPVEEAKGNLDETRESNYAEVIDMDYLTQDGIGIKIDSMLMTDDCFDAKVTFKFAEDVEVDSQGFDFAFAIYDENNNIYAVFDRIRSNTKKIDSIAPFLYEELGIKYNIFNMTSIPISDRTGFSLLETNEEERTITKSITLRAKTKYPKSKKIYMRLYDLGYRMLDIDEEDNVKSVETFDISNAVWKFEIDVPNKFLDRKTIELNLQNEIPEIEMKKITITETSLVMDFKSGKFIEERENLLKTNNSDFFNAKEKLFNISDGEGKVYQSINGSFGDSKCKMIFDIGLKDLEKGLFLNFTLDGKTYTSELIENK